MVKNITLVKNEYEYQILRMLSMLRIPPYSMFHVRNTHGGSLPLRAVFSCTFEARYCASRILLVSACVKRPFCVRKLPFLLTKFFFTRDAKYPFYLRKI